MAAVSLQVRILPLKMLFIIATRPTPPYTTLKATACSLTFSPFLRHTLPHCSQAVAADGVSFAIPTDAVREIVRQFHQHGRVIRPFIGITMLEVSNGEAWGKVLG